MPIMSTPKTKPVGNSSTQRRHARWRRGKNKNAKYAHKRRGKNKDARPNMFGNNAYGRCGKAKTRTNSGTSTSINKNQEHSTGSGIITHEILRFKGKPKTGKPTGKGKIQSPYDKWNKEMMKIKNTRCKKSILFKVKEEKPKDKDQVPLDDRRNQKRPICIHTTLGGEKIKALNRLLPHLQFEFTGRDAPRGHPLLHTLRRLGEEEIMKILSKDINKRSGNGVGRIVDIGASRRASMKYPKKIWGMEVARTPRKLALVKLLSREQGKGRLRDYKFCGHDAALCDCNFIPTGAMMIHSIYYNTPENVAKVIYNLTRKNKDFGDLYSLHHPLQGKGENELIRGQDEGVYVREGENIKTFAKSNIGTVYRHENIDWIYQTEDCTLPVTIRDGTDKKFYLLWDKVPFARDVVDIMRFQLLPAPDEMWETNNEPIPVETNMKPATKVKLWVPNNQLGDKHYNKLEQIEVSYPTELVTDCLDTVQGRPVEDIRSVLNTKYRDYMKSNKEEKTYDRSRAAPYLISQLYGLYIKSQSMVREHNNFYNRYQESIADAVLKGRITVTIRDMLLLLTRIMMLTAVTALGATFGGVLGIICAIFTLLVISYGLYDNRMPIFGIFGSFLIKHVSCTKDDQELTGFWFILDQVVRGIEWFFHGPLFRTFEGIEAVLEFLVVQSKIDMSIPRTFEEWVIDASIAFLWNWFAETLIVVLMLLFYYSISKLVFLVVYKRFRYRFLRVALFLCLCYGTVVAYVGAVTGTAEVLLDFFINLAEFYNEDDGVPFSNQPRFGGRELLAFEEDLGSTIMPLMAGAWIIFVLLITLIWCAWKTKVKPTMASFVKHVKNFRDTGNFPTLYGECRLEAVETLTSELDFKQDPKKKLVTSIPEKDRKGGRGAYLAGPGFYTCVPQVFSTAYKNLLVGVKSRVTRYVETKASPKLWSVISFMNLTRLKVRDGVPFPPIQTVRWLGNVLKYKIYRYAEYVARFPPAKRALIKQARWNFFGKINRKFQGYRQLVYKVFVKREKQMVVTKELFEPKKPRIIMGLSWLSKALAGPWFMTYSLALKLSWNIRHKIWFCSGYRAEDFNWWINNVVPKYKIPYFVVSDYSTFDITQGELVIMREIQRYVKLGFYTSVFLGKEILKSKYHTRAFGNGIKMSFAGMRKSGCHDTCSGNSGTNGEAMGGFYEYHGIPYNIAVLGDDSFAVICFSSLVRVFGAVNTEEKFRKALKEWITACGFVLKLISTRNIIKAEFLSMKFFPCKVYGHPTWKYAVGKKPGRCLVKIGWLLDKQDMTYTKAKGLLKGVLMSYVATAMHVPFLRIYVRVLLSKLKDVPYIEQYQNQFIVGSTEKQAAEVSESTWDAFLLFYGLTKSHEKKFEKRLIKRLEKGVRSLASDSDVDVLFQKELDLAL